MKFFGKYQSVKQTEPEPEPEPDYCSVSGLIELCNEISKINNLIQGKIEKIVTMIDLITDNKHSNSETVR